MASAKVLSLICLIIACCMVSDTVAQYYGGYGYGGYGYGSGYGYGYSSSYYGSYGYPSSYYGSYGYGYPSSYYGGYGYYGKREAGFGPTDNKQ